MAASRLRPVDADYKVCGEVYRDVVAPFRLPSYQTRRKCEGLSERRSEGTNLAISFEGENWRHL